MRKVWRLIVIFYILFRYGLDEMAVSYIPSQRFVFFYPASVFLAESVGSTGGQTEAGAGKSRAHIHQIRTDAVKPGGILLPGDVADELSKLQDRGSTFRFQCSRRADNPVSWRASGRVVAHLLTESRLRPLPLHKFILRNCITGMRLPSRYCALKCKSGSVVTSN